MADHSSFVNANMARRRLIVIDEKLAPLLKDLSTRLYIDDRAPQDTFRKHPIIKIDENKCTASYVANALNDLAVSLQAMQEEVVRIADNINSYHELSIPNGYKGHYNSYDVDLQKGMVGVNIDHDPTVRDAVWLIMTCAPEVDMSQLDPASGKFARSVAKIRDDGSYKNITPPHLREAKRFNAMLAVAQLIENACKPKLMRISPGAAAKKARRHN